MIAAAADLNAHLKNIKVSMSCILFFSIIMEISSYVKTAAITSPAMGTTTFLDSVRIMEKTLEFQDSGVFPTSVAIVATLLLTSLNILDRLPVMAPIKKSFSHCSMASIMLCISRYPCRLDGNQAGQQRNHFQAEKHNAAARHKLFYPQLGVKLCSMAGGGVQKIYMMFLREPSQRDRSGSDLFHLRDGFEIKMNFDRNVSCFIFVNALMHDDFFD